MIDERQGQRAGSVTAPAGLAGLSAAEARAVFAAARRRRRRRRLAGAAALLVLAGSAAAGLAVAGPENQAGTRHGPAGLAAVPRDSRMQLPPARVAWADDAGQLHIADLATGAQQVVATVDASSADPMTAAGGRLYWADISHDGAPIRSYDIATGKIRYLGRGSCVFASADGSRLYIVESSTRLSEQAANGRGTPGQLTVPAGWYMSGGLDNWAVAGGIIVYSAGDTSTAATAAVWNPATGAVQTIGHDLGLTDVWTPAGASYSLIAWTSHGLLGITSTATMNSLTVRSPGRYGFTYGGPFTRGAFSPDGTRLAVFLNITSPQDPSSEPVSEPAIFDTRTGSLRLARAARLGTYEGTAWARWLPGGKQVIVGAEQGNYAIDAATLAVSKLSLAPGYDINFSATILPSR
jgi:hypothetical protein